MPNPTPNADAAPVAESLLQRRLQREIEIAASGGNISLTVLVETKQRLDHLEARERAGRELARAMRDRYGEGISDTAHMKRVDPNSWNTILTHLDGGSTDA